MPITLLHPPNPLLYPYSPFIKTVANIGKYGCSTILDPTGGDGIPTPSGYENVYMIDILPAYNRPPSLPPLIASDLLIDSVSVQAFPISPSTPSLHGLDAINGASSFQAYEIGNTSSSPEIEAIGIYEIYEADNGDLWNLLEPGPQPSITINLNPVAIRLYIALKNTFTNVLPLADKTILFDIDFSEQALTFGCTDSTAFNYDSLVNTDDGSCYPFIYGCMDPAADNFITLVNNDLIDVNTDDGSCQYWGCIDPMALNQTGGGLYDCSGTLGGTDTSCCSYGGPDCIDPYALNYVSGSNYDCLQVFNGTNIGCCNYPGADCLDPTALNYHFNFVANNSVDYDCYGYLNGTNMGCCNYITSGCTDPNADNYDSAIGYDCNSHDINDPNYTIIFSSFSCCTYAPIYGCMDTTYRGAYFQYQHPNGYVFQINWNNPSIENLSTDPLSGCWPPSPGSGPQTENPLNSGDGNWACWGNASNWGYLYEDINLLATAEGPGDCVVGGCMDNGYLVGPLSGGSDPYDSPNPGVSALNYDSRITYDNGSCIYFGCMDSTSSTYAAYANADSVLHTNAEIEDALTFLPFSAPTPPTYDPANGMVGDCGGGYILGCTDPLVSNYNPLATIDDGSCCVDGCMDEFGNFLTSTGGPYDSPYPGTGANNYNPLATCDDGTFCTYTIVSGCMDADADNYDSTAVVDDGSCLYDGCIDLTSKQADNLTLAVTNPGFDCNDIDRSLSLTGVEPDCSSVITGSPSSGWLQHYYTCEYNCATSSQFYAGLAHPEGIALLVETREMPWFDNNGIATQRKFFITFRYGPISNTFNNAPSTHKEYAFILTEDNTSSGEWYVYLGFGFIDPTTGLAGPSGISILKQSNALPETGVTVTNTCVSCDTDSTQAPAFFTLSGGGFQDFYFDRTIKPFISSSTGGGVGDTYSYYHDGSSTQGACNMGLQASGNFYWGCTNMSSNNYDPNANIDDGSCLAPCDCCNEGSPPNTTLPTVSNYSSNISYNDTDPCSPKLTVTYSNVDPVCGNTYCDLPTHLYMAVEGLFNGVTDTATSSIPVTFPLSGGGASIFNTSNMVRAWAGSSASGTGVISSFPFTVEYNLLGVVGVEYGLNSPSFGSLLVNPETDYTIEDKIYKPGIKVDSCVENQFINATHLSSNSPSFDNMTELDLNSSGVTAPTYGCNGPNAINYNPLAVCPDGSCVSCANWELGQMSSGQITGIPGYPYQIFSNWGFIASGPNPFEIISTIFVYKGHLTNPIDPSSSFNPHVMPQKVTIQSTFTNQSSTTCNNGNVDITLNWVATRTTGTYPYEREEMDFVLYSPSSCPFAANGTVGLFYYLTLDENIIDPSIPLPNECIAFPPTIPDYDVVFGCTNPNAMNPDPLATIDDGSCIPFVYGCMQPCAINFYPGANVDDGSCIHVGCIEDQIDDSIGGYFFTDINGYCADAGFVYDPLTYDCNDPHASYTSTGFLANGSPGPGTPGATHECGQGNGYIMANYDPAAIMNDGSCDCQSNPTGILYNAQTPGTWCECVVSGANIGPGLPNSGIPNGC
tara:strand:+ start:2567 stop:7192 length:4626 start_codon:yes stop_codon:yes gene_type:complete